MKVLLIHNRYQQAGGEDAAFEGERSLLASHGHDVRSFTVSNETVGGLRSKIKTAGRAVYSTSARRSVRHEIERVRPDVVHVHNFFPLLSPSVYDACRDLPVVQTLHNYRLLCPNALFFRDGHACEDCLGRLMPWPGVAHACYRDSRTATLPVATMLTAHRLRRTWTQKVAAYIALTGFARDKFVQGGLPQGRIAVKPNFVHPDPGMGERQGRYVLFVGRLSEEKGVETLLAAHERLAGRVRLKIVGDGPLAPMVAKNAERRKELEWLGRQPRDRVVLLMKEAQLLLFPSVCYEGFPMVIAEAYAAGLPVVASNRGSMISLVSHGRTGLHFDPDDPGDLAAQIDWALTHPPELGRMREEARAEFENEYTAERNYQMLMDVYRSAIVGDGVRS
jgi:glycosyltransferase involved in cell wall biosynthesis